MTWEALCFIGQPLMHNTIFIAQFLFSQSHLCDINIAEWSLSAAPCGTRDIPAHCLFRPFVAIASWTTEDNNKF